MATGKRLRLDDVVFAAAQAKGSITGAAERLGCSRWGLYQYLRRHAKAQRAFDQEREKLVDEAEQALWECVAERQPWAVALILKTIGRGRGYGEKPSEAIDRGSGITLYWDDQEQPTVYLPHKDPLPEDLETAESAARPAIAQASSDEDAMLEEVCTLRAQMQALIRQLERSRDGTSS
jgi:hypothetical protein